MDSDTLPTVVIVRGSGIPKNELSSLKESTENLSDRESYINYFVVSVGKMKLSRKDENVIKRMLRIKHNSGGTYHVVAGTRNGLLGKNAVFKPAPSSFPDMCGRHAEIHLLARAANIKRETVYIVGRNKAGNVMRTTKPCKFCRSELIEAGVRKIVYFWQGKIQMEALR